jgi:phosphatidylglycerophosphate synthase
MAAIFWWTEEWFWRFLVKYTPESLRPNHFTILRLFILAPLAIYFTLLGEYSLAFLFFLLAALSDAWDGILARRRGLVTRFGKTVDPVADKILIVAPAFLAWLYLSRPLLITYFLGEIAGALVSLTLFWQKKIIGSNTWGKITVVFLSFSVVPWLFLLPKSPTLLITLNILLGIGILLRWISFFQYCQVFRKPLPR